MTSKKDCGELSMFLQQKKIKANFYHTYRKYFHKKTVQEKWKNGEINVIFVTVAFGMGINSLFNNFLNSFKRKKMTKNSIVSPKGTFSAVYDNLYLQSFNKENSRFGKNLI